MQTHFAAADAARLGHDAHEGARRDALAAPARPDQAQRLLGHHGKGDAVHRFHLGGHVKVGLEIQDFRQAGHRTRYG